MHRLALLFGAMAFALAGVGSYYTAQLATDFLENETEATLSEALQAAGQTWAKVDADGLQISLQGLAPDEESRFKALEIIGKLVETSRLEDSTTVESKLEIEPPRFTLELLRNVEAISLIGLIPAETGRDKILGSLESLSQGVPITDLLETVDHPPNSVWGQALDFALESLEYLPRSKISVVEDLVRITAVTESVDEKRALEQKLRDRKPDQIKLILDLSSPRQVISPFAFRVTIKNEAVELISCSADTKATAARIIHAVKLAGYEGAGECDIGLGVPTTEWAEAVTRAVFALQELGGGTLSFTDSDISLIASEDADQATYDRVIGQLENQLPELFSMLAVLPPKIATDGNAGALEQPEFTATKSPEGLVQLRGRVANEQTRQATEIYAASLFGKDNVYNAARIDEDLPDGWPMRVLGGLEAMSFLHHGTLIIQPNLVEVRGTSANPKARSEVSRVLSSRLGGKGIYRILVEYDKSLFKVEELPNPADCADGISAILSREQIEFAPASTIIEARSRSTITKIADILRDCPDAKFSVEGHTDSQGREELNLAISQRRAEAVILALSNQRVLIEGLSAIGHGPKFPIADNETEEGRAKNRRIEFKLVTEDTVANTEDAQVETSDGQN